MTANIIQFPRMKPMAWSELPDYWCIATKIYYQDAVNRGEPHEQAFRRFDLSARAPDLAAGLQFKDEPYGDYIARLESIALNPDQALGRYCAKQYKQS